MNVSVLKIVYCAAIALGSFLVFLYVRGKPWELRLYKGSVVLGTALKIIVCLMVYTLWPQLNKYSDALNYIFPQTLEFMSGKMPYRDFVSTYSILFCPFFSLPLLIWRSVGAIVLTVLLMETAMIILYLRRCRDGGEKSGWRTAFLYCFSPFSFYWVALSGHNGVMIAFWTMLSLVAAERGRAVLSSAAAAFGFSVTKILAVLAWPGIVFYNRRNWIVRVLPMAFILVITAGLLLFDIDVLSFMKVEGGYLAFTSGNLPFVVSRIFPGLRRSAAMHILPVLLFAVVFIPMFIAYVRRRSGENGNGFDVPAAFVASTYLLFMAVSKVSFNYYIVMALIFVIHTLMQDGRHVTRRLIPVTFIGTVTYLEQYLFYKSIFRNNAFTTTGGFILFLINVLMVCSYIYLAVVCFRYSIGAGSAGMLHSSQLSEPRCAG